MLGEVRPQWTPATSAGRARLRVDDANWQLAESARVERSEAEMFLGDLRQRHRASNAQQAAMARRERLEVLHHVRATSRTLIDDKAARAKAETREQLRQLQAARAEWEQHGRTLPAHDRSGIVRERQRIAHENVASAREVRRQREAIRDHCARELTGRLLANQEKAMHIRQRNTLAVRSVSAAELRDRQGTVDTMRRQEASRDRERYAEKHHAYARSRSSHEQVHRVSSRECVAHYIAAERARKAAVAAAVRESIDARRLERAYAERAEEERKRALHDAVRRGVYEGYAFEVSTTGEALDGRSSAVEPSGRRQPPSPRGWEAPGRAPSPSPSRPRAASPRQQPPPRPPPRAPDPRAGEWVPRDERSLAGGGMSDGVVYDADGYWRSYDDGRDDDYHDGSYDDGRGYDGGRAHGDGGEDDDATGRRRRQRGDDDVPFIRSGSPRGRYPTFTNAGYDVGYESA